MYFDHQHFPLVWMRRAEGAGQPVVDPYQQLEALTQRAQAFVLMSDLIPEPEQRNSACLCPRCARGLAPSTTPPSAD